MRNVNVDKPTDKPVDGTGFILTMRNVNLQIHSSHYTLHNCFILTMRNVNNGNQALSGYEYKVLY